MKKLLPKLLLLFIIFVAASNLIFWVITPSFCWGNGHADTKNQYLLKNGSQFNTLFIGSSKTMNEADVTVFDSLTNHRTKSFNFGVEAVYAAETLFFTDELTKNYKNMKYVFIEVSDFDFIAKENLSTSRVKYLYNFDVWAFTINALWHSNYGYRDKIQVTAYSTIALFEWLVKFDLLKDLVSHYNTPYDESYLGGQKTGFLPNPNDDGKTSLANQAESRRLYLLDTATDRTLTIIANKAFTSYNSYKFNTPYYNRLTSLINKLKQKNITVFLILPPRTNEVQLMNTVPVFMRIENCAKINLADPQLNPEFYQSKYSFDARHLNLAGAQIYSEKIARVFNQTIAQ